MIISKPEAIFNTMRENNISRWAIREATAAGRGAQIGINDADITVNESIDKLQSSLDGITGEGYIVVYLFDRPIKKAEGEKGGDQNSFGKFHLKISHESNRNPVAVSGFPQGREKELTATIEGLRSENESLKQKIYNFEFADRIRKEVDPLKTRIKELEEEEDDSSDGIGSILDHPLVLPILSKLGVNIPGMDGGRGFVNGTAQSLAGIPPAENRLSSEEIQSASFSEWQQEKKMDDATEMLIELYGLEKIADLLSTLAGKAKNDPVKFGNYFSVIKNL